MEFKNVRICLLIAFSALIVENGQCREPLRCKDNWLNYSNACYLFDEDQYPHRIARKLCRGHFSSLLVIENELERQWIATQLMKNTFIRSTWFDDRSKGDQSYKVPFAEEPDSVSGQEKCVVLNANGYLRDEVCSKMALSICKIKKLHATYKCPTNRPIAETSDNCFITTYADKTWEESYQGCKAYHDGDLMSIGNILELGLVRAGIKSITYDSDFWIGLHYDDQTQSYKFTDGTPYSEDTAPWLNKDSDLGSDGCAALISSGKFTKNNCDSNFQFICKYPLERHPGSQCPDNWHRAGGSCYYVSEDRVNWTQAETECKSMDANLLKMDSSNEKHWLVRTPAFYWHYYWVGLNARSRKGVYVWQDGTKLNDSLIEWNKGATDVNKCVTFSPTSLHRYQSTGCWKSINTLACEYKITTGSQTSCAKGWLSDEHNKCYYFSSDNNGITWFSNIDECKKMSRGLNVNVNYITIESKEEENFIVAALGSFQRDSSIWLGMNNVAGVDKWVWQGAPGVPVDNKILTTIFLSSPNPEYRCVVIGRHGIFRTTLCDNNFPYICEKQIKKRVKRREGNDAGPTTVANPVTIIGLLTMFSILHINFVQF